MSTSSEITMTSDEENVDETLKLVKHPFYIENADQCQLYETPKGIEYHFDKTIFSPKITAEVIYNKEIYFECEVDEDGNILIINRFDSIRVFNEPAGFYISQTEDSKMFYEEFHRDILDTDIDNVHDQVEKLNTYLSSNNFPDFINGEMMRNRPKETALQNSIKRLNLVAVKEMDEVPLKHSDNISEVLQEDIGTRKYVDIQKFINENLQENMLLIKEINRKYERLQSPSFTSHNLKYALIEHFYVYPGGPFRKIWIRFGYDPKKDWNNYIYQRIFLAKQNINFIMKDNVELVREIEKNREWYIKREYDSKLGFLTESCIQLIIYTKTNKIDYELKDHEYEIFD